MLFRPLIKLRRIVSLRAFCTSENRNPTDFPDSDLKPFKKIIKVAIIGSPNSGKSTLINRLIGYNVCGVSSKTETTREKLQAALTIDDTQIVFVDTPGIVKDKNIKKFKLEKTFVNDALTAIEEANIVGVIHDIANFYTNDYIDYKIIQVLENLPKYKKAFLVLNKVDKVKKKRILLEKIRLLTSATRTKDSEESGNEEKDQRPAGWPNFSRIFLISALHGDGIEELANYLQDEAHTGYWEIAPGEITDANPQKLILNLMKAHFLDLVPHAIPRFTSYIIDHFEMGRTGDISCIARLKCLNSNHKNYFIRWKSDEGRALKVVAERVEQDMSTILKVPVRIKIVVDSKTKLSTYSK